MARTLSALLIAALLMVSVTGAEAAQPNLKRGIYADTTAGCKALTKADRKKKLTTSDILDGSVPGTASFLVVERTSIGSVDFECRIGAPRAKGKYIDRALNCSGESSGSKTSMLRELAPGKISLSGGLAGWGTVYFCR